MNFKIINLSIFDDTVTQTTLLAGLSPEMKTYYEKRLLTLAEPKLVHDQFGDKYPIPRNNGKSIEFRRYSPLSKASKPLVEGVTPVGNNLNVTTVTSEVAQYGDWVRMSDMLEMSAIDNNVVQATRVLGSQAGRTLDSVTREVLAGGRNVLYSPSISGSTVTEITSRTDITSACKLTVDDIFKAKTELSAMNADTIDDSYVAIIHPYVSYDLMRNEEWIDVHKYARPENIYEGEIGKIGGVRFVETSEAKIFAPDVISDGKCRLTVKTAITESASTSVVINEVLTSATPSTPIPVYINGVANTITAITTTTGVTTLTVGTGITATAGTVICGKNAGKDGSAVFATIILGAHAYGLTEISGGGLQHIVKQLGYGDDPLNQRSSCGWKAVKAAERLVEEYMIRIESGSSYSATADTN